MPKPPSHPIAPVPDAAALLFFGARRQALPLCCALHEQPYRLCPTARLRVQKSRITCLERNVFACVSFARVMRKAALPSPYLVLTPGLPASLAPARAAVKTSPAPGAGPATSCCRGRSSSAPSCRAGSARRRTRSPCGNRPRLARKISAKGLVFAEKSYYTGDKDPYRIHPPTGTGAANYAHV